MREEEEEEEEEGIGKEEEKEEGGDEEGVEGGEGLTNINPSIAERAIVTAQGISRGTRVDGHKPEEVEKEVEKEVKKEVEKGGESVISTVTDFK